MDQKLIEKLFRKTKITKQYCTKGNLHHCFKVEGHGWFVIKQITPIAQTKLKQLLPPIPANSTKRPRMFSLASVLYANTPHAIEKYIHDNIKISTTVTDLTKWVIGELLEDPDLNFHTEKQYTLKSNPSFSHSVSKF